MFDQYFFFKKVSKIMTPQEIKNPTPIDSILLKIFACAYTIKKDKRFKYINKNNICLYDTCLFIAFVVRWLYFSQRFLTIKQKDEFDSDIITRLAVGFSIMFNCPEIKNAKINISRFSYYSETTEEYYHANDKNDIIAAFDEYKIILKSDIIANTFKEFTSSSPLCVLKTLEENFMCEQEALYVLQTATESFNKEIYTLLKQ